MPLLKITYSHPDATDAITDTLLAAGTRIVVDTMGKPERFVMAVCETEAMRFGGSAEPCALVELRSLGGLDADTNVRLSRALCDALAEHAGVPPERTFLHFVDVARDDWGWNGGTFGQGG